MHPGEEWRAFVFVEPSLLTRLMGRDRSATALDQVFVALEDCLRTATKIRELTRENDL